MFYYCLRVPFLGLLLPLELHSTPRLRFGILLDSYMQCSSTWFFTFTTEIKEYDQTIFSGEKYAGFLVFEKIDAIEPGHKKDTLPWLQYRRMTNYIVEMRSKGLHSHTKLIIAKVVTLMTCIIFSKVSYCLLNCIPHSRSSLGFYWAVICSAILLVFFTFMLQKNARSLSFYNTTLMVLKIRNTILLLDSWTNDRALIQSFINRMVLCNLLGTSTTSLFQIYE